MTIQQFISTLDASYNDYLNSFEGQTPASKEEYIKELLSRIGEGVYDEAQDLALEHTENQDAQ
jgi:hypothetical protein